MIFRIPAGRHYARPWRFGINWNRKSFEWRVQFTDSCRYDLGTVDQLDTNKLCGVGYIFGLHHVDSARFGWRYVKETGQVEVMAYCYVNRERVIQHVAYCEIGKAYDLHLTKMVTAYFFACYEITGRSCKSVGTSLVQYFHEKKLGYGLPVYFGGNRKAPQTITIQLQKL